MTGLTETELMRHQPFVPGVVRTDCERCRTQPWGTDGDDVRHLAEVVERIIAARLAPIRALADEWREECDLHGQHFANGCAECADTSSSRLLSDRLRAALDATGADLSASQDHDGAEGQP